MAGAANTVDQVYITQYEAMFKIAYQQMTSMFMGKSRTKRNVTGDTVKFPTYAAVEAVQKAQNADVTPVNPVQATVSATMADWYVPIYSDTLDELKTNVDERMAAAKAGAGASGRKVDSIVTDALKLATQTGVVGTTGMSLAKIRIAIETLDAASVPNDGRRWAAVGAHQWQELEALDQFVNADYIGTDLSLTTGRRVKDWQGIKWFMHPNLPLISGTDRNCYIWHEEAVGVGVGQEIKVEINYIPEKASWLTNHMLSVAAVIIEQAGVYEIVCDDDKAIS